MLMEYAPFGDFTNVVLTEKFPRDEVLARSYFHQMIDGLEYLHS